MNKERFSSFEIIIILGILFMLPTLFFLTGILSLFQTSFSKEGIIASIFMFGLGIISFYTFNLYQVIREFIKDIRIKNEK